MITVKLSSTGNAINKRIKNLPDFYVQIVNARLKKDAMSFVDTFQSGIRDRDLRLKPLKKSTIESKRRRNLDLPSTPLYGKGDSDSKSYINMYLIRRLKNGWRVRARVAKHYSGVKLRDLLAIHEFGATINAVSKSGTPFIIIIPARPAATRAFNKYMRKRKNDDPSISRAVNQHIRKGRSNLQQRLEQENAKKKKNIWFGNA